MTLIQGSYKPKRVFRKPAEYFDCDEETQVYSTLLEYGRCHNTEPAKMTVFIILSLSMQDVQNFGRNTRNLSETCHEIGGQKEKSIAQSLFEKKSHLSKYAKITRTFKSSNMNSQKGK